MVSMMLQPLRPLRSQPAAPSRRRRGQTGFTLTELVIVIVVMGILAAYAVPRMFNTDDFNARGFHDGTLAYLRFAQKTAVAQRRMVCVTFPGTNTMALTMALNASTPAVSVFDCSTPTTLTGPQGESPVTLTAKPGANYSTTPAPISFNFDSLGRPLTTTGAAQATQTFQVVGVGKTITVETSTGYIHE